MRQLDAIAVTEGPGLAGALLVGITYAKALAFAPRQAAHRRQPPRRPHPRRAAGARRLTPRPPARSSRSSSPAATRISISPSISDGTWHYRNVGHTVDDAAGEAYDKVAKLLGLGYPGGPWIDDLAPHGNPRRRPLLLRADQAESPSRRPAEASDAPFVFSFSGIKTAVLRYVETHAHARASHRRAAASRSPPSHPNPPTPSPLCDQQTLDLIASFQCAVVGDLKRKTFAAAEHSARMACSSPAESPPTANCAAASPQRQRERGLPIAFPALALSTDNAAMIAAAAWPKLLAGDFAADDLGRLPSCASASRPARRQKPHIPAKITREPSARLHCDTRRCGNPRRTWHFNSSTPSAAQIEPLAPADGKALRLYAAAPPSTTTATSATSAPSSTSICCAAFSSQQGVPRQARHEHHRRRRQDHPQRRRAGVPIADYTAELRAAFLEDLRRPRRSSAPSIMPHATENIPRDGRAHREARSNAASPTAPRTAPGTSASRAFPEYGKLSQERPRAASKTARASTSTNTRRTPPATSPCGRPPNPASTSWDTALGHGRPGWHIECSAMAMKFLGDTFDLHAGGEDLMFPHHENEIAQSESATGKPFARHWMHVRFLLVEGRKMSKSEGNFYTLRDLLLKGYTRLRDSLPAALRALPPSAQLHLRRPRRIHHRRRPPAHLPPAHPARPLARRRKRRTRSAVTRSRTSIHRRARQRPQHRRSPRRHLRSRPPRQHRRRSRQAAQAKRPRRSFTRSRSSIRSSPSSKTTTPRSPAPPSPGPNTKAAHRSSPPTSQASLELTDADIDALVAERTQAKKTRNFARADAIRNDLPAKGILLEDSQGRRALEAEVENRLHQIKLHDIVCTFSRSRNDMAHSCQFSYDVELRSRSEYPMSC